MEEQKAIFNRKFGMVPSLERVNKIIELTGGSPVEEQAITPQEAISKAKAEAVQ